MKIMAEPDVAPFRLLALFRELDIDLKTFEWTNGCSKAQLWSQCPDPTWLLLVIEQLHACDARTVVRLAYEFAFHVRDSKDSAACAVLDLVKRWSMEKQSHGGR